MPTDDEVNAANQDAADEAAFAAGFNGTHDAPVAAVESEGKAAETSATPASDSKGTDPAAQNKAAAAQAPAVEPSRIAGLTEDEMKALFAKVPALEQALSQQLPGIQQAFAEEVRKVYGKIGELNRTLESLRQGRKLSAAQLKRLNTEFPEIAGMLAEDFSEIYAAQEGQQAAQDQAQQASQQAAAPAPQAPQQADIQKLISDSVNNAVAGISAQAERKALALVHPGWEEIVQSPEFATWLQSLPPEQARHYAESEDARIASEAISLFSDAAKAKANVKQTKQTRLERAVAPTGESAPAPNTIDDEQAFVIGFNSQRGIPA